MTVNVRLLRVDEESNLDNPGEIFYHTYTQIVDDPSTVNFDTVSSDEATSGEELIATLEGRADVAYV